MNTDEEIKQLLTEIRDQQALALKRQEEQLALSRDQIERSRSQVGESIDLQKQAMRRFMQLTKVVLPTILICIALIAYLVITWF